ncbi:MAG: nuclear transport factor 2 family protein [Dehalococcoidia bacterium]|nr:nuclear transport factor 2 family protein [Dehalococcoidia bacterium]
MVSQSTAEADVRAAADIAFANFKNGLAGDAEALAAFIDGMHDEVVLYFPQGPNLSKGAYRGKDEIRELFSFVSKVYNTGLFVTLDQAYQSGDTIAWQFHDKAVTRDGSDYRGTIFISFKIKDGKLYRYREYFGARWLPPVPANDDPQPPLDPNEVTIARAAMLDYNAALNGDRAALNRYLVSLHDDAALIYPQRPGIDQPLHAGKAAIRQFVNARLEQCPGGIETTIDRTFVAGDSVAFAVHRLERGADGAETRPTVFVSLKLKDGKVWRQREYIGPMWGEIVPPHDDA